MRIQTKTFLPALFSAVLMTVGAESMSAQIVNPIVAHINHSFSIGDVTLPPGQYTFQMLSGSDLSAMTVRSADGNASDEFLVLTTEAPTTPKHSEVIFNRYGDHQFLTKIYEKGSRTGVQVVEPSREESRLQKQGQHPTEHAEEQQ